MDGRARHIDEVKPIRAEWGTVKWIAVFIAICFGLFFFIPQVLPSGIGLTPVPVEVFWRPSYIGAGHVAVITNRSAPAEDVNPDSGSAY